jgi:hypothetical protein
LELTADEVLEDIDHINARLGEVEEEACENNALLKETAGRVKSLEEKCDLLIIALIKKLSYEQYYCTKEICDYLGIDYWNLRHASMKYSENRLLEDEKRKKQKEKLFKEINEFIRKISKS